MMNLREGLDALLRHRNAYFLALSATTGTICFGWDTVLIGGVLALPSFQQYFGLDREPAAARAALSGNITSVLQAGGFFGAIISSWFANRYGRKPSMLGSAIVFIIGSSIQSIVGLGSTPATGLKLLYFGRFFGGVGVGLMTALAPTYISECAPRSIRGQCTGCIELAFALGSMLAFWINYGVSVQIPPGEIQWRVPFICQIVPGVLFFLLMLFQPESPRWLVDRERYEDAARSLAYIARTGPCSPAVQSTLSEIRADFDGRRKLSLLDQFRKMGENKTIFLRCFMPSLLAFFQEWTGTNAVNYYSPQIFASLGLPSTTATLLATGIYGVIKFISAILFLAFVIESWGRKRSLIYGGLVCSLAMFWIGGYTAIHADSHRIVPATYVSLVAVYLFGISFVLSWGINAPLLAAEIAPGHIRPAVMAIATGVVWLFSYVIAQATPRMLATIGWGTYIVFGVAGVIMTVWVWAGIPETTGVALEDVGYLFDSGGPFWVRCVQDAPGGRWVLGGRRAVSVEELKKRAKVRSVGERDSEASDRLNPLEKQSVDSPVGDALII